MAGPGLTIKEASQLKKDAAEAKEEAQALKEALTNSANTISRLLKSIASHEALIDAQARRISQLEVLSQKPENGQRSVLEIIQEVLTEYPQVTVEDVCGDRRVAAFIKPRHQAMAKVYVERQDLSLVEIGENFGGRNHATVQSAVKKMGVWRGAL